MRIAELKETAVTHLHTLLNACFPDTCAGCGKADTLLCSSCLHALPSATPGRNTLTRYKDPAVKHLLWRLKYKRDTRVAHLFAPSLAKAIRTQHKEAPVLLAPIPLSPKRRRARGYNQAQKIAEAIQQTDPRTFVVLDCLTKTRDTQPQTSCKNKRERMENIAGAFHADIPEEYRSRSVIVVDDVTTTGATLSEAERALTDAGAQSVSTVAIAH